MPISAKTIEDAVDALAGSRVASALAIVIVALVCFLPGLTTLPPLDSDETRFAVTGHAMVASGDLADMRLQGEQPAIRPPLGYWLQALTAALAGEGTPFWVHRLPTLVAALGAPLLVWWTMLAFGRPRAALIAACLLAASVALNVEARVGRADALLFLAICAAEGALARIWLHEEGQFDRKLVILFWAAAGLGILAKGPVAPLVLFLTVAFLAVVDNEWDWLKRLKPARGLAITLVIAAAWPLVAFVAWHEGLLTEPANLERLMAATGQENPVAPPGSYFLVLPLTFGTGLPFLLLGIPGLLDRFRWPVVFFALAWLLPFWAVAELSPIKRPEVFLPAVAPLAMLAAIAVDDGSARIRGWFGSLIAVGPVVAPAVVALMAVTGYVYLEKRLPVMALIGFAGGVACGAVSWTWLRRGRALAAVAGSVASAALVYASLFGLLFPYLSAIRVSERLVAAGRAAVACADPQFAVAGYPEQSLIYITGTHTRMTTASGAAEFLDAPGCRAAFVEARQVSSFRQRAEDIGIEVLDRGKVTGLNLGRAQSVDIRVYAVKEPAK